MSVNLDFLDEEFLTEVDAGNIEYAGFWIRVGAAIIDAIVLLPLSFLTYIVSGQSMILVVSIISTILYNIYKPLLEYSRQATFGKQALGIKVVNQDLKGITINQALLRASPWLAIGAIDIFSIIYYSMSPGSLAEIDIDSMFADIPNFTPIIILSSLINIVFLISVIKVGFSNLKRGLHDDLADTYCIRT